jgi:crotonobetaine/carnitine-CoA ligase
MTAFRSNSLATLNAVFMSAVEKTPDRAYLDFSGDMYTYARLAHEVERAARGLHELGVRRGDRVVTILESGPDAIICWFAINRLGAIHVPINTAYQGDFLRHQVNDCGARIVICENEFVERVTALAGELLSVEHILFRGLAAESRAWKRGFAPLEQWKLDAGDAPFVDVAPSDLAAIIYTSGTTGMSKGCTASHNYFCDITRRYGDSNGIEPGDIHWSPMPLFHIAGICVVLSTLQKGAIGSLSRKFSASGFWREVERSKASVVMMLGSMAQMVVNTPDDEAAERCRGQVRTLVAAPMSGALAEIWYKRFGLKWVSGLAYGSTEAGLCISARFDEPVPAGSCGRVNEAFEIRVVDENDEPVPPNQVGEIVVRPKKPCVMFSGYWNNPEATAKAWRNLWHHMGDQARVDENGNFFFVDRSKDVIRRRGENISSFELETAFSQHPDILEVAIHAVSSDVLEDDVKATVVLKPGAKLRAADLLEWARPRVPKFALPRYVEFRAELPKTASGRVQKFELRAQGVTSGTWDSQKG